MSEMIERVAREVYAGTNPERNSSTFVSWEDLPERMQTFYCLWARATIAAMREPTEAMKRAGGETDVNIGERIADVDAGHVWRDMIDQALK